MIQLFIILLISFTEILIQTLYDTWLKKKGKPVKHTLETFIGICGVIAGILIFLNELPYDAKAYALAYYFSVRFMFYDLFYNKFNNLPRWNVGETAMTDRILKYLAMPPIFIIYGRMTAFAIGTILMIGKLSDYWEAIGMLEKYGNQVGISYLVAMAIGVAFVIYDRNIKKD